MNLTPPHPRKKKPKKVIELAKKKKDNIKEVDLTL